MSQEAEDAVVAESDDPSAIPDWEEVGVYATEEEADIVVDYLAAQEIAAQAESLLMHGFPVATGSLGTVRVRVPAEQLAAASEALARRGEVALAEDAAPEVGSGGEALQKDE
jgi:hypothetical protein